LAVILIVVKLEIENEVELENEYGEVGITEC